MNRTYLTPLSGTLLLISAVLTPAQNYSIPWHTIDGGGAMNSTDGQPGGFELSGTVGQPDAGSFITPMTGGPYSLVGGFWAAAPPTCTCPGDMNGDGLKDGRDLQRFTECVVGGGACSCADVDGTPGVDAGDVSVFVSNLLAGATCP